MSQPPPAVVIDDGARKAYDGDAHVQAAKVLARPLDQPLQ